jgi:hypothetical protein
MNSTLFISDILDNPNFDTNSFGDLMILSQEFDTYQLMIELNS